MQPRASACPGTNNLAIRCSTLTLDNFAHLPTRSAAFTNTLFLAAGGTALCLLVGYPLAYYLATRAGSKKTFLLVLVIVPFCPLDELGLHRTLRRWRPVWPRH